jgi:hypothetical protein
MRFGVDRRPSSRPPPPLSPAPPRARRLCRGYSRLPRAGRCQCWAAPFRAPLFCRQLPAAVCVCARVGVFASAWLCLCVCLRAGAGTARLPQQGSSTYPPWATRAPAWHAPRAPTASTRRKRRAEGDLTPRRDLTTWPVTTCAAPHIPCCRSACSVGFLWGASCCACTSAHVAACACQLGARLRGAPAHPCQCAGACLSLCAPCDCYRPSCPPGTFSTSKATECTQCPEGRFRTWPHRWWASGRQCASINNGVFPFRSVPGDVELAGGGGLQSAPFRACGPCLLTQPHTLVCALVLVRLFRWARWCGAVWYGVVWCGVVWCVCEQGTCLPAPMPPSARGAPTATTATWTSPRVCPVQRRCVSTRAGGRPGGRCRSCSLPPPRPDPTHPALPLLVYLLVPAFPRAPSACIDGMLFHPCHPRNCNALPFCWQGMVCVGGLKSFRSLYWRDMLDTEPLNTTASTVFHKVRGGAVVGG